MRREGNVEGIGQSSDAARLGYAAGAGCIRLDDADRTAGDEIAAAVAGMFALPGREPQRNLGPQPVIALDVLGNQRLFEPVVAKIVKPSGDDNGVVEIECP